MPQYEITRWVCGSSDEIPINEARFEEICTAKDGMLLCTELEERLAVVLENYHEFEVEIFAHGLRWALHQDWRWEARQDQVFVLNRRLLSFLNAVWMYFDHAKGEFRRRPSISSELGRELTEKLKSTFSSKALLSAQLLRNYCQHQRFGFEGVGVSNSNYKLQREIPPSDVQERNITAAVLAVRVSELALRGKHPSRVILEELRARRVETWDPGLELRQTVDRLTHFHTELRQALSEELSSWTVQLTAAIEEAEAAFTSIVGLCVVEKFGRGQYGDRVEIFPELVERVKELRSRNGDATALESTIVANAIPIAGA